eukprot:Lankesteria_metandrocarpae@DN4335_c0_g1_i2.p2
MVYERLLCQGAEAKIYEVQYLNKRAVRKERLCKAYRHPELDAELTKKRIVREVRNTARCRKAGIDAPAIYDVDLSAATTLLEYIDGYTIKELLQKYENPSKAGIINNTLGSSPPTVADSDAQPTAVTMAIDDPPVLSSCAIAAIARRTGYVVGKLHSTNLVHGDLTSSNIMIRNSQISAKFAGRCQWCINQNIDNKNINPDQPRIPDVSAPPVPVVPDCNIGSSSDDSVSGTVPPASKRVKLDKTEHKGDDCQSRKRTDVVVLDLGLSCTSAMIEDKAVDLYVLERATGSLGHEFFFEGVLEGYRDSWKNSQQVLDRLEEVRQRGRKRNMEG